MHNTLPRLCEGPRKPIKVCFCDHMECEWAPRSLYKFELLDLPYSGDPLF